VTTRTLAALLADLNRHRGNGQQKVAVEHVHVHSGGPGVGVVQPAGVGITPDLKIDAMQRKLPNCPCTSVRDVVPTAGPLDSRAATA
jgi:hypothetical protein